MKKKRIKKFSKAIIKFLEQEGEVRITQFSDFNSRVIIDKENLQFLLVQTYWNGNNFKYQLCCHIEIREDKIVILQCNKDVDLMREFNYLGILAKHIRSADSPKYLLD